MAIVIRINTPLVIIKRSGIIIYVTSHTVTIISKLDKIRDIISKNDNKIVINKIELEDETLYIEIEKPFKGIFKGLIKTKKSKIKSSYKGYFSNDKKVIERNK